MYKPSGNREKNMQSIIIVFLCLAKPLFELVCGFHQWQSLTSINGWSLAYKLLYSRKQSKFYLHLPRIFEVKLTFEMSTVRDTNVSSWESVKVFETESVSTWGGLEPPTFGFMPNALTYWAIRTRHLLSHVVEYWLWWYRYFSCKVNIWNVNWARATAFIFDTRTGVLGKMSMFWDRKCLDLRRIRTPNLRIYAECFNLLSYQSQTFAIPCCWILAQVL